MFVEVSTLLGSRPLSFAFHSASIKFPCGYVLWQNVFENSLMQHHVALPPDSMGKITYIAPPGQYSLKVGPLLVSTSSGRLGCSYNWF